MTRMFLGYVLFLNTNETNGIWALNTETFMNTNYQEFFMN